MLARDTQDRREKRSCLRCNRSFISKHRFNRLCEHCAKKNATVNFGQYVLHARGSSVKTLDDRG